MRIKHRGFAAVTTALVLLSLAGLTVAGLMTRVAMDARRTRWEIGRAQHEQILIAQSLGGDTKLPDDLKTVELDSKGIYRSTAR